MLHFGDNLANFKPIEHLYKTDVIKLARLLKSRDEVINQSPSAKKKKNQEKETNASYRYTDILTNELQISIFDGKEYFPLVPEVSKTKF